MLHSKRHLGGVRGFTLLELLTVVVIMSILITLLLPAYRWYQERAFRMNCTNNLKGLYVAAAGFVQANGQWPQIRMKSGEGTKYNEEWLEVLKPYGISHLNWICPAAQRALGGPDYTAPKTFRVDYLASTFDEHQGTPNKWPKHPWFIERANVHGTGPLMILTDGSVIDLQHAMLLKNEAP